MKLIPDLKPLLGIALDRDSQQKLEDCIYTLELLTESDIPPKIAGPVRTVTENLRVLSCMQQMANPTAKQQEHNS